MNKKLYLVTLINWKKFYVIGNDSNDAYEKVLKHVNDNDLYFTKDRELKTVELIAEDALYRKCEFRLIMD